MAKPFKGTINLDVRDSVPDWDAFTADAAPEGAPNVLVMLYDDTGLAAWSPFGGRIEMPTLQKLADNGLMYSQWHTTALCSPTRSTFLTGRNHNVNRCASIMEGTDGFPGAAGRLPAECATIGQVLQDNGYRTLWLGKNHNVPGRHLGRRQPIRNGRSEGFDRFYGFLGGETNNWYPDRRGQWIHHAAGASKTATICRRISPTRRWQHAAQSEVVEPSKPWFMVLSRRGITRRTIARRNTPTNTKGSSTTATKHTASGHWRG